METLRWTASFRGRSVRDVESGRCKALVFETMRREELMEQSATNFPVFWPSFFVFIISLSISFRIRMFLIFFNKKVNRRKGVNYPKYSLVLSFVLCFVFVLLCCLFLIIFLLLFYDSFLFFLPITAYFCCPGQKFLGWDKEKVRKFCLQTKNSWEKLCWGTKNRAKSGTKKQCFRWRRDGLGGTWERKMEWRAE